MNLIHQNDVTASQIHDAQIENLNRTECNFRRQHRVCVTFVAHSAVKLHSPGCAAFADNANVVNMQETYHELDFGTAELLVCSFQVDDVR